MSSIPLLLLTLLLAAVLIEARHHQHQHNQQQHHHHHKHQQHHHRHHKRHSPHSDVYIQEETGDLPPLPIPQEYVDEDDDRVLIPVDAAGKPLPGSEQLRFKVIEMTLEDIKRLNNSIPVHSPSLHDVKSVPTLPPRNVEDQGTDYHDVDLPDAKLPKSSDYMSSKEIDPDTDKTVYDDLSPSLDLEQKEQGQQQQQQDDKQQQHVTTVKTVVADEEMATEEAPFDFYANKKDLDKDIETIRQMLFNGKKEEESVVDPQQQQQQQADKQQQEESKQQQPEKTEVVKDLSDDKEEDDVTTSKPKEKKRKEKLRIVSGGSRLLGKSASNVNIFSSILAFLLFILFTT